MTSPSKPTWAPVPARARRKANEASQVSRARWLGAFRLMTAFPVPTPIAAVCLSAPTAIVRVTFLTETFPTDTAVTHGGECVAVRLLQQVGAEQRDRADVQDGGRSGHHKTHGEGCAGLDRQPPADWRDAQADEQWWTKGWQNPDVQPAFGRARQQHGLHERRDKPAEPD
jgi:hypothetical protein